MHILSPETDIPFLNQQKGENDRRNYFMINLHESMWPDWGSNQQPLDAQSDLLPTGEFEKFGPMAHYLRARLYGYVPMNAENA